MVNLSDVTAKINRLGVTHLREESPKNRGGVGCGAAHTTPIFRKIFNELRKSYRRYYEQSKNDRQQRAIDIPQRMGALDIVQMWAGKADIRKNFHRFGFERLKNRMAENWHKDLFFIRIVDPISRLIFIGKTQFVHALF